MSQGIHKLLKTPQGISSLKKRMPLIIAAAALLLFSGLFLFLYFYNDTLRFHHMTEEFFAEAFRQDSLSLHYTLAEPSDYLQKPSPATLPCTPDSHARKRQPHWRTSFLSCRKLIRKG